MLPIYASGCEIPILVDQSMAAGVYVHTRIYSFAVRSSIMVGYSTRPLPVTVEMRRNYSFSSALVDAPRTERAPIRSDAAAAPETLQPLQSPWDRPPAAARPAAPARRGEQRVAQRCRAMQGAATSRSSSRHLRTTSSRAGLLPSCVDHRLICENLRETCKAPTAVLRMALMALTVPLYV